MGGILSSVLGDPLKGILGAVGDILDKFVASPEQKLQAQQAILKAQSDLQVKLVELDEQWAQQQAGVITAEAKSDSWLARNWRPILMLTFTFIIAWNFIFSPLFTMPATPIPPDMWSLLKIGMGGYIVGRSVEKAGPALVTAVAKAKA